MAGISGLGDLALNTAGETVAFLAGVALGPTLAPLATAIVQEAWQVAPIRAPEAGTLALGVAQGQVDEAEAAKWAKEHGYGETQWKALVDIANSGPALGYAFQAWRRGLLDDGEFNTALRRTGLETAWDHALEGLRDELLDPGALATAIHRGIIAGQGLLVREPPSGEGRVPSVPQSNIDAVTEAAGLGITSERLRVLVGNTGLPLSLGEMLQLLNRGLVLEDDVRRSIAQSNVRNEYMDVALGLRRRLLTPTEYIEGHLRGWIDEQAMLAGAALHGMEHDDAEILFKLSGRPIPEHQVTTGEARGGVYNGPTDNIPEPFLRALQQGSLRPEWYSLAYANRYTYPSAFVLRALATSGELSPADVQQTLLDIGWRPDFAEKVAKAWTGGTTAKADPHVSKAETQLWGTVHKSYVDGETQQAEATTDLEALGVAVDAVPAVLALWDRERDVVRRSLTEKQITKAFSEGKFARDEALARLERLGLNAADAATVLDE